MLRVYRCIYSAGWVCGVALRDGVLL
jgi:hypothetical protein